MSRRAVLRAVVHDDDFLADNDLDHAVRRHRRAMMTVADAHADLHRMHTLDDLLNRGYFVVTRDED